MQALCTIHWLELRRKTEKYIHLARQPLANIARNMPDMLPLQLFLKYIYPSCLQHKHTRVQIITPYFFKEQFPHGFVCWWISVYWKDLGMILGHNWWDVSHDRTLEPTVFVQLKRVTYITLHWCHWVEEEKILALVERACFLLGQSACSLIRCKT